ncbi:MAG: hypothetical protein IKJ68_10180 [Clostridia bacterium]|nr:hypothetical protein [Clostridia bacterium]
MKRTIKLCLSSAIGAYIIKFLVDVVMYIFLKNDQNDLYYDFWYLFVPQIASSLMLIVFYLMFFSKKFYGLFFMISTAVLMISNIVFIVLIYFDSAIGYTFYFALIAAINFLNALYLKCNIIPEKKAGNIEYIPMIFELIPFVCMVISLYSVFCTFPTLEVNEVTRIWEYYDLMTGMKLNMVSEAILIFAYFLCSINNAEFIRDNMFDEPIQ